MIPATLVVSLRSFIFTVIPIPPCPPATPTQLYLPPAPNPPSILQLSPLFSFLSSLHFLFCMQAPRERNGWKALSLHHCHKRLVSHRHLCSRLPPPTKTCTGKTLQLPLTWRALTRRRAQAQPWEGREQGECVAVTHTWLAHHLGHQMHTHRDTQARARIPQLFRTALKLKPKSHHFTDNCA